MKLFVLDANAVIRFLSKSPGEDKVTTLIQKARSGDVRLLMSVMNWGEALYAMARKKGIAEATTDLRTVRAVVECMPADQAQAESAATIKLHYHLGYADAYAAALAITMNATLVTADPDFAKLGKQLKILSLPRHSR